MPFKYPDLQARILANSCLDPDGSGCWLWLGQISNGYARLTMRVPGKPHPVPFWVHRLALQVFRGIELPPGIEADHIGGICSHTFCVNPMHLRPLSKSDNSRDGQRNYPRKAKKNV